MLNERTEDFWAGVVFLVLSCLVWWIGDPEQPLITGFMSLAMAAFSMKYFYRWWKGLEW